MHLGERARLHHPCISFKSQHSQGMGESKVIARCLNAKCKADQGNTSNPRKHLVKHRIVFLLYQLTLSHALVTDCDRLEVVKTGLGGEKEVGRDFSLCGV